MKEHNDVSKWFIGLSVLLVVVGIVMIVWPNLTMDLLGIMIGICMLVVGLAHIILYFTRDHLGVVMHMDLTVGVVLAGFGAFMLMHKDFVSMALPFAVGIELLIGGISKIQYALDMKRLSFIRWKIMLIVSIVMIVFAMVLLYNPFNERVLIYAMGFSLIVDGAVSITAVLMISHRVKKMARGAVYTGKDSLIVEHREKEKKEKGGFHMPFHQPETQTVENPVVVHDPVSASDQSVSAADAAADVTAGDPQETGGENMEDPFDLDQ